jgi:uncharacterized protein YbjT (DUF2867 family)
MKVLVIGASGATGTLLLPKLLEQRHAVTAFARNPKSVPEREGLRVEQGDATDAASLERAVQGQDAVVSVFGPRGLGKSDVQETLARNLIAAMQKHGVKRLVNLSAWGAAGTQPSGLLFKIIRGTLLKNVFADKERGETLFATSGLDVTHVCPGRLLNSPARGGVKVSPDGAGLESIMTRADLAEFMVGQLSTDAWVRRSVVIGY